MLEASPDLVDLTLYHDWVLNLILSLKNPLSKLRRLKLSTGGDPMARGRPTFDMPPPHKHPLGLFIQRLSQVEEIDLGMLVLPSLPSIPLDFDELVELSSSLRRFSAPPHLCAGLFASQVITERLESLTIKPAWLTDPGQHYELIDIMGKVAWDLPCLKELIFPREYCAHPPKYLELASMLRAAPGLVKLDIGYFSIGLQEVCLKLNQLNHAYELTSLLHMQIDKLLELLTYIPVLEELIIFDMVTPPLSTECWDSLNSVLLKLKETCPKLRQIEIYHRRCHNNETSIAHWMDTDLGPRWIPQVNDELVNWWINLMSNIARNSPQAASYGGYHD
ncbi:F-box-like domain containing protein [Ceratobasidium theobromae]|uniref:F-box-like domain containing protein n=1 Tax=Ceratobasidium theobromae TaxID=1582974 RepID=A0A5N5Q9G9_9AGAM|nr:F-box-like domain containing protein [Ceratobasidium theobromae]